MTENQATESADCAVELRTIGEALLAAHDHLEMHKLERSHCNSAAAIREGIATYSAWKKRPDLAAPAPQAAAEHKPCKNCADSGYSDAWTMDGEFNPVVCDQCEAFKTYRAKQNAALLAAPTGAAPAVAQGEGMQVVTHGQVCDLWRKLGLPELMSWQWERLHQQFIPLIVRSVATPSPAPAVAADDSRICALLSDFRAKQVEAGIPEEDLMPADADKAVEYLIRNVKEWR